MTEPTCAVTGKVKGHPEACGDCDPCVFGSVSAPVQSLLDEIVDWRNKYEDAEVRAAEISRLRGLLERAGAVLPSLTKEIEEVLK